MQDRLLIQTFTWRRENYDLFDYDSKEINKWEVEVSKSGILERNKNRVSFNPFTSKSGKQEAELECNYEHREGELIRQNLMLIQRDQKQFYIQGQMSLWLPLKNKVVPQNMESHELREGDEFKLGKIHFKVNTVHYIIEDRSI